MTTIEEIDSMIETLKTKKRILNKKTITRTPKKVIRHNRQVRCMMCGLVAKRSEMQQISKYEYQHAVCPVQPVTRIVRIEFN